MRAAEEAAFARGITAEALMDEAAAGIARVVSRVFPNPGRCIVFGGKGNNAGDVFAAAELLHARGWDIDLRLAFPPEERGELARKKLTSLRSTLPPAPHRARVDGREATIILDGLLGVGASGALRDPIRSACREINRLRADENAFVFAADLPTGLDADSGSPDTECVTADFVVTIGYAKRGLIADESLEHVGRIEVAPLSDIGPADGLDAVIATAASLRHLMPRRAFSGYKNKFGRVGVVAGSRGLTGAAVLCAMGAMRAGAGLLRVYVLEDIYEIVATGAPPEAMIQPVKSYQSLGDEPVDVWAVGPGLGHARAGEILHLIEHSPKPMVIDADGLNILSKQMDVLARAAGPRLVTPHPGEMKRLAPGGDTMSRAQSVQAFCEGYPAATILLKGSRSIIGERGQPSSYNTTGNAGMSTGGMGDALTGVCAALMAQQLTAYDAARLAAWLCGRAADIALFSGNVSEQSLLPRDVIEHLGRAFHELHL
jgi:ADP-dependent NAD(P)H-hydrate dehydratase / NAD(P)H-hydrate epimerase